MKIVAFGASSSKNSINKALATYAASLFEKANTTILDLNDFEMPVFSVDKEINDGIPEKAIKFYHILQNSDLIIISLTEHNGSYTTAFKNIFDWVSRHHSSFFENKKLFLLSTSTGQRGGKSVMDAALVRFPFHGAEILENFSLPKFYENFDSESGILDGDLQKLFLNKVNNIKQKYGMANR